MTHFYDVSVWRRASDGRATKDGEFAATINNERARSTAKEKGVLLRHHPRVDFPRVSQTCEERPAWMTNQPQRTVDILPRGDDMLPI